jgi:hypothetical protein
MEKQYEKIIAGIAVVLIVVVTLGVWFYAHQNASLPVQIGTQPPAPLSFAEFFKVQLPQVNTSTWKTYTDPSGAFTIRYPADWTVNTSYVDSEMGPGAERGGVAFVVPATLTKGTNLGDDTSVSIETHTQSIQCNASDFFDPQSISMGGEIQISGKTYSVATGSGAGAGNRYEEIFASVPGSSPCFGAQLFIHSSVIENYPPGTVTAFDRNQLLAIYQAMVATFSMK